MAVSILTPSLLNVNNDTAKTAVCFVAVALVEIWKAENTFSI